MMNHSSWYSATDLVSNFMYGVFNKNKKCKIESKCIAGFCCINDLDYTYCEVNI